MTPYQRLMRRTKPGPTIRPELGPCIDSTYYGNGKGYVQIKVQGKNVVGSRIALEHKLGRPLAVGMYALHHCDRRHCLNENHLYEGTYSDNAKDRDSRTGNPMKQFRGEKHPRRRLNEALVREIRRLTGMGCGVSEIARNYRIPKNTIRGVVVGRTWAHVGVIQ